MLKMLVCPKTKGSLVYDKKNKEDKINGRVEKKDSRRNFRLAKIQELTAKAYAVATKR